MTDAGLVLKDVGLAYGANRVIDSVSLQVRPGRILGLVGESGSGKTTVARAIAGTIGLTSGSITLNGVNLASGRRSRDERRAVQLVPQDPFASLNPQLTIAAVLDELLRVHHLPDGGDAGQRHRRAVELLDLVGLDAESLQRYPRQFSGGQRQRIAIARALAVEPAVLIADEPTSSLDVSVQKTVLELLRSLSTQMNLATLFISHDLSVINAICDEVAVLRGGELVETAQASRFFTHPQHPYSRALLEAVPRINKETR
jgi:ABC-type glutathione transport system ATPase component